MLTHTDIASVLYAETPPLFEDFTAGLPPALALMHRLLQAAYTLNPATLVREEKNKGTGYHGSTTLLTVHLDRVPSIPGLIADVSEGLRSPWSLDGLPADVIGWLAASPPLASLFVDRVEAVEAGSPGAIGYQSGYVAVRFARLRSRRGFVEGFTLNSADEAIFLAAVSRMMELGAAIMCEYGEGPPGLAVQQFNARAMAQVQARYTYFLVNVLRLYARPERVEG